VSGSSSVAAVTPPEGVVRLNAQSAFVIRATALAVMVVPFAGLIEAVRLIAIDQFSRTDIVLFGAMYFVHMGGITMGFHRLLAHRSFKTSKFFRAVLTICGSMGAQGPLLYWAATHRRHHTYSDHPGDPHSPNLIGSDWKSKLRGLWYAHMPWMLSDEISSVTYYAKDLIGDRQLVFLNRTYLLWALLGLVIPTLVGAYFDGGLAGAWQGFIFGGLARMFLANQAAWCVGSVSHMFGSRPFDTQDQSANNWWVAIFTFGEGLQNNHHAFSWWYRHGAYWWEPDLSGWLLALFSQLGLVWDLKKPSSANVERRRKRAVAQAGS